MQVSARLVHEGTVLSPGFRVSECALKEGDLIDVIWFTWIEPPKEGNSGSEVLPRRSKESLQMADGHLDASGIFVRDMMERQTFAAELASQVTATLRILDVRQCGLRCENMCAIFEQLPESLEELWASRNHIDAQAMRSLGERSLTKLGVLDVGYSECEDLEVLPDLVNEKMEQLILGDLKELNVPCLERSLAKCPELRRGKEVFWRADFGSLSDRNMEKRGYFTGLSGVGLKIKVLWTYASASDAMLELLAPHLFVSWRFLDIHNCELAAASGAIARSAKLQKLFARRVDLTDEGLTQILSGNGLS